MEENKVKDLGLSDEHILWDRETVSSVIGLKANGVYSAIKNDGFPAPILVGGRRSLWKKSDVLAWIDSRPQELSC